MIESIEQLVRAKGGDGSSATSDDLSLADRSRIELLLEAWTRECGRSIERSLLLDRVRRLLSLALAQGRFSDRAEREARRILQVIAMFAEDDLETWS